MSVSGVSTQNPLLATLLASMPQLQSSAGGAAASTGGSSGAYLLSLGKQQAESAVLGYNQLGKLVNQAEDALQGLGQSSLLTGGGQQITTKYSVVVQQLAAAQSLSSASYPDADKTVVGTGTLTIELGTVATNGQTFTANGGPVTVSIKDGTLDGIASAINGAAAGVTAKVVQGSDGSYQLVVTGNATGAASAFSLSGIAGLAYDPTGTTPSAFTHTQAAQDARYTVNGTAETSPSNENAPVAPGVVTNLTALGQTTVTVPFGQQQAVASAERLAGTFNALLASIGQLTGTDGQLSADPGVAFTLAQSLSAIAGATFSGGKTLADIGITTQSDGTLAIDPGALQAAYAADPSGTSALVAEATQAARQSLATLAGPNGTIGAETRALVTVMSQQPSLLSSLMPGGGSSGTLAALSALATPGQAASAASSPTLADYLLAMSNGSGSSAGNPLLAGLDTTA